MLHQSTRIQIIDKIQRVIAKILATNPAGRGLCLIGGFRLRLLNNSPRISLDIDYHFDGAPETKLPVIHSLFERRLLPEVKRNFGYSGSVAIHTKPDDETSLTKVIDIAFFKIDVPYSRIEIPVDITNIKCMDKPKAVTAGGNIYLTVTDQDMIESKVISFFNRVYIEARDIVDIFLFEENFNSDSSRRLAVKLKELSLSLSDISLKMSKLLADREYHIRNIENMINNYLEIESAERITAGGGSAEIFDRVFWILKQKLLLTGDNRYENV